MSISASLGNALSGLYAARAALDTISANVANANTVGYARKTVDLSVRADVNGGAGGVEVRSIVRCTDAFLHDADVRASADRGRSEAYATMASELDAALGEPGSGRDLSSLIGKLRDAMSAATAAPQDVSKRRVVVDAADAMAQGFRAMSEAVGGVRDRSTATLKDLATKLNEGLASIAGLNQKIVSGRQAGMETGSLEDQREAVITQVSSLADLKLLRRDSGAIDVLVGLAVAPEEGREIPFEARRRGVEFPRRHGRSRAGLCPPCGRKRPGRSHRHQLRHAQHWTQSSARRRLGFAHRGV